MGQKEPPRLGSTICYGQEWARKSHQDSGVRFVTAKRGPERATKTRQYDLLRARGGQKEPPRLGSTICYDQELARKSHQDSAVRFVTDQDVGQKEPPRLGSAICYNQMWARKSLCYGQTWARKSHRDSAVLFVTAKSLARKNHQDSAVRFVTVKSWPERATKTRQYDLLRPRVVQKEPPRLGSAICYGQDLARKSHQDSAVRFVMAKSWPERATKTRQYDLLRPNVGQKEPPRLGSTICYGQTWARKSHQDSGVRFVTAKRGPERATKTRQYDLLRARGGQKEPPRLGSTICYGQELARKSHQDSPVRFVTAKSWPEGATKTRQYDLLRPRVGQKEPPRLGSTICYGQEWARKSHQDSAVRFVTATANRKSLRDSAVRFVIAKSVPERATKTRQYDLLRPNVGQKEPPRLGFVTAKSWPEGATKTRQYDLLRPRVGQKEPPRLGSTICYGQDFGQKEPPRLGSTICYGQTWARKSHRDSAVRFVTAKSWPERATKTRQYDLLRPRVGQKEPPVRFVTAKSSPEGAIRTRQYDLLRPRVGQKEPPRLGSTICYGQTWARKSHQDSAVRFATTKRGPERATKTRQYDLLRPRVGQKEPPRLGSTICYGQALSRKSHQDSAVRFVTAKRGPERATKTRQYDLLWPNVGQKEPPRLGSTICYGQTWARKSHQDSAVRFVTAKSWPERATKTRQYDLLRPKRGPERTTKTRQYDLVRPTERATETRQYDLLRPNVGQKEPPRLGSTICYGQTWARKSHQDSAVRFVAAKSWPEIATKTR